MDRGTAYVLGIGTMSVLFIVLMFVLPPDRPMQAVNVLDVPITGVTAVRNTNEVPAPIQGYIQPGCTMLVVMECENEDDEVDDGE